MRGLRANLPRLLGALLLAGCVTPSGLDRGAPAVAVAPSERPDPDPQRFREAVEAFGAYARDPADPRPVVLGIGSSSMRMWDLAAALPEFQVFNAGFGGSEFSDVNALWEFLSPPVDPAFVLVYEGDNDIGGRSQKSAAQTFEDFLELMGRLQATYPDATVVIIPAKPSPARWKFREELRALNEAMGQYAAERPHLRIVDDLPAALCPGGEPDPSFYVEDALHLSAAGYAVWNACVRAAMGL